MTEHQTVEYKHIWKDAYLKWIWGFANVQGGVLVIGRNDRLVGRHSSCRGTAGIYSQQGAEIEWGNCGGI